MNNQQQRKHTGKTRVVMARNVAKQWILNNSKEEFRLHLYTSASSRMKNLLIFLKMFRDGKSACEGLSPIPDLGIKEEFDAITLWTSDHSALFLLNKWLETRGVETSGIW